MHELLKQELQLVLGQTYFGSRFSFGGQAKDLVGSRLGSRFGFALLISIVRDLAFRSNLDVWWVRGLEG